MKFNYIFHGDYPSGTLLTKVAHEGNPAAPSGQTHPSRGRLVAQPPPFRTTGGHLPAHRTFALRDRTQPIILFLHGFMGDCRDFAVAIEYLPEFCCLTVDLPGHGETTVTQDSDYQMENIALGLIELLAKLQIERCILVGYSMGGRIALYLTIHFPQFFIGTVLESASPGLATKLERDRRIVRDLQLSSRLETESFADFLNCWYANPLFESFRIHPNYQQAVSRRLQNQPMKLAKSLRGCGLGQQPSLWKRLTEIQRPLLMIIGELDSKFRAINQRMFDLTPQARLIIVENSGHNVHFEHPGKFSQLLMDFAADCDPQ